VASIKPVAKAVYVCDNVLADLASGKVTLVNLLNAVRLPAGANFPYRLNQLCVFVLWSGGLGELRTRVDIVDATGDGQLIRRTDDMIIRFASRTQTVYGLYRIEGVVFPAPGSYCVEVYCQGAFVDDLMIRVIPE
jgi:hypothetical protein